MGHREVIQERLTNRSCFANNIFFMNITNKKRIYLIVAFFMIVLYNKIK
jgi:hypothetical protein